MSDPTLEKPMNERPLFTSLLLTPFLPSRAQKSAPLFDEKPTDALGVVAQRQKQERGRCVLAPKKPVGRANLAVDLERGVISFGCGRFSPARRPKAAQTAIREVCCGCSCLKPPAASRIRNSGACYLAGATDSETACNLAKRLIHFFSATRVCWASLSSFFWCATKVLRKS